MFFVRFTTNDRFWMAFSSILPTELQMKQLLSSITRLKIRVSWVESSSNAPSPSESITRIEQFSPSAVYPRSGLPQIQSPLVQGFTVGPTPKPSDLFNSIRLRRYDFPVLYIPATATTPMGAGMAQMISNASSFIIYSNSYKMVEYTLCLLLIVHKRNGCFSKEVSSVTHKIINF